MQLYGRIQNVDGTTSWKPIAAIPQPDGTYALKIDSELTLDSGNINISNLKIGSVDQTSNTLRYIKVLDDGTVVVTSDDPLAKFKASRTVDSGVFPHYFGLVDEDTNWVIIRESKSGLEKIYEYAAGSSAFLTNWGNRVTIPYDEYPNVF